MQNETQYIQEETIDLRELFAVLKKRKKLIAWVTGVLTLLAAVYAFVIAKPVYEAKGMIEIGQIDDTPIADTNDVKQKLSYEYKINSRGIKHTPPYVKAITVPKGSKSILSLIVESRNNEEGKAYIEKVIQKIEREYKAKTDAYIDNQKELIALTQQDIDENRKSLEQMQKELSDYSQKIISLKREDAALAGIYALQIGQKQIELQRLKKYISSLKIKKQELKLSITPIKMRPTHIVGEVETSDKPVKPKKALIVIVALITGLMLSVFLAFFLEFLSKGREQT